MSEDSDVVVYGYTVGYLAQKHDQLSPSFCEELISLNLSQILWELWIQIGQLLDSLRVEFLWLLLSISTIRQEVPQCFVTSEQRS